MSNIILDHLAYSKRLKRLYDEWKNPTIRHDRSLNEVDCIVFYVGVNDDIVYSKSAALQTWLFGHELTDTLCIFAESSVYILSSKKKIEFLAQAQKHRVSGSPKLHLLIRDRGDKDQRNIEKLIKIVKSSKGGKVLGGFPKDTFDGEFSELCEKTFHKSKSFITIDISGSMAYLMCPKDEPEINNIRKAALVSMELFNKYLKDQIMEIVDSDKKIKHNKLTEILESALCDQKYINGVDTTHLDMCYPPIIQSGGNYSLKFSAVTDKNLLHFGVIVCCLGTRYKSYCSNISRTFLVNPTDDMKENYNFLVRMEDEILKKLEPGAKLNEIYNYIFGLVKKERPDFVPNLTKNFGFAMGLEFRESSILIGPKCYAEVRKNMVFNVVIGVSNIPNKEADDKIGSVYALMVGDTVLIGNQAPASIMTPSKKKIANIGIFIKGESDEDAKSEVLGTVKSSEILNRSKRNAVLESKLRTETNTEEKRKEHQKELARLLNVKARERLAKQNDSKEIAKIRTKTASYKSVMQMPREHEIENLKLYVDKKYETVIMPVFGIPVPYHISTIKNISQSIEGEYTYLRVNFFHPGATMGRNDGGLFPHPEAVFVKEVTYRSSNIKPHGESYAPSSNLNNAFRIIKEVQKRFKTREAEEREKEDLVKQDTIVLSQNKGNPKLKDLYIRPNIVTKRMTGSLEAHINGFRYISVRGDKVDLLYNNIKTAFFQPCDGEMIILLHFHLKHAILFGKKKHIDVQFYTEVGEITTDLGKHQHMHDRDDVAAEQAERELRYKLKTAFSSFCEKVELMTKQEVEFDTPFRELGFPGAPFRSTVTLQPTSGSLVNLTEWPPFVITLEDVELVHFERVQFHLRNFDMVFVFKNYQKKVATVNAVPMSLLDHVKEWLNSCDIRYTEGIQSLNWAKIMKTITDDPTGFFDQGGWTFLDPESASEEFESGESSDDAAYEPTDDADSDIESEEEESEYSDISEEESNVDSEEESGMDWSDLEREAEEEDRNHDIASSAKQNGKHHSKHSKHSNSSKTSKEKERSKDKSRDKYGINKHHSSSSHSNVLNKSKNSHNHHHMNNSKSSHYSSSSSSSKRPRDDSRDSGRFNSKKSRK